MPNYRVEIDGETVWSGKGKNSNVIPPEYRDRPDSGGAHNLFIEGKDGDVLIGVQSKLTKAERLDADRAASEGN